MDPQQYLLTLEKFGIKFGLANIRALCAALGEPQRSFRSVLIAGTNGKGSVTAMVERGLRAAGVRTGRYTSPHLIRLEERFAIDGVPIESQQLNELIGHVRGVIDGLLAARVLEAPPTFFEVTTAIAFEAFRRAGVDIAILEVGLGGRLDSTNCVEPIAAAITSIAFDHQQYLGSTLAAIAAEKAGVVRPDIPVVLGPLDPEARAAIEAACAAAGARIVDAPTDVSVGSKTENGRTTVHVQTAAADYGWIPLGLRGAHQITNAAIAVRLIEEIGRLTAVPIPVAAVATALGDVEWPGRLQLIDAGHGRHVLLDAAHNPAGASALAAYLRREFPEPLPLVFGAMRDKDVPEMLNILLPVASTVIMTEPRNARAHSAHELAGLAHATASTRGIHPRHSIIVEPEPAAALDRAFEICPMVCAAGSIFLIGDLLAHLESTVRSR